MTDKIAELGGNLCNCCGGGPLTCLYVWCCPLCAYAQATSSAGVGCGSSAGVGCGCILECLLAHCVPCVVPIRMGEVNEKLGGVDDTCCRCCLLCFCQPCVCPCMICQFWRAVNEANRRGLLDGGGGGVVVHKQAAPQPQGDMSRQSMPANRQAPMSMVPVNGQSVSMERQPTPMAQVA